ncbi:disulfide bond formation protein B [Dongia sp.]|uniref:disulfide bond formation protein B n=1 Tax=Dongia sp. TaxID=1977262 RepID=UPI0035ADB003
MSASNQSFIDPRHVPWLTAGMSLAALCAAWLAQYGFGLAPCHLCLLQRDAYWAAIALSIGAIALGVRSPLRRWVLALVGLAFLAGAGVALYHVGVERQWWQGSEACIGGIAGLSGADLEAAIMNAPVTRCDEIAFEFLGISMAGYNGLLSLALAAFAFWGFARAPRA